MKLLILSDLHLEFGIFNVPKVDYDVVILAGDIFVTGSKAMRWAHFSDRAWLAQKLAEPFAGPTVVVTHHAPHRNSLAPRYQSDWLSPAFVSERPDSFFEVPSLWIHGHLHESHRYQAGSCQVVCNPRGYVRDGRDHENKQFNPGLVVEL